jgi:hypothetical protein
MCSLTKVVEATFSATPSGVAFCSVALPLRKNFVGAGICDKELGASGFPHEVGDSFGTLNSHSNLMRTSERF